MILTDRSISAIFFLNAGLIGVVVVLDPIKNWVGIFLIMHLLVFIILARSWYCLDKARLDFNSSLTVSTLVLLLPIIGLPIYFLKSRGFVDGFVAILKYFICYLLGGFIVLSIGGMVTVSIKSLF